MRPRPPAGLRDTPRDALLAADVRGTRFVLVNGFDAWVDRGRTRDYLSAQRYTPGVVAPVGAIPPATAAAKPWPRLTFRLPGGGGIAQEIFPVPGRSLVAVRWTLPAGSPDLLLGVRFFLSGREEGSLHLRNGVFRMTPEIRGWRRTWRPYDGVPDIAIYTRAAYRHDPHWYDNFLYADGSQESLASPGIFEGTVTAREGLEIVLAGGWGEAIEGMILPEEPVLWVRGKPRGAAKRPGVRPGPSSSP
ncbi:MAG: glycogen debranching enzyme N-terminal domain-containing protein [Candidatus Brocadiae bacterium]|nr:glycogen debranching enzyme N-terminal domain-containing protein [Candidatus Brocadiia bacterium]